MFSYIPFGFTFIIPESYLGSKERFNSFQLSMCIFAIISGLCYKHGLMPLACEVIFILLGIIAFAENIGYSISLFRLGRSPRGASATMVFAVIMGILAIVMLPIGIMGQFEEAQALLISESLPLMFLTMCMGFKRKQNGKKAEAASKLKKERERFARCLLRIGMKNEARSEGADISV